MKSIYKAFLFEKHILVSDCPEPEENPFEVLYSLANLYAIHVTEGAALAHRDMLPFAAAQLGANVPRAFYKGFPQSVRELSPDQLLFDQLLHYAATYGLGDFSAPGRSVFEEDFERTAFRENVPMKDFVIMSEADALDELRKRVDDLFLGSRPLSENQFALVLSYISDNAYRPQAIASRNTAVRLLLQRRDLSFAAYLSLPDVIKVLDEIVYANQVLSSVQSKKPAHAKDPDLFASFFSPDMHEQYLTQFARMYSPLKRYSLKKLNLPNRDRRLLAELISRLIGAAAAGSSRDALFAACCEKKKIWCGLLHHIHFRPQTGDEKRFAALIRGRENPSAYSKFERAMTESGAPAAAGVLKDAKGSSAVLRNLNYIVSRCRGAQEIEGVCRMIDSRNAILLTQLLLRYSQYRDKKGVRRSFRYVFHNMMRVFQETPALAARRKTVLSGSMLALLNAAVRRQLEEALRGRLGRVYIAPSLDRYALPLQEGTSQGGFGVLPKGTRLPIDAGIKKVRAFTYWEQVNDIDLSVIGLEENGNQREFSWRTMSHSQSGAITYSGDQVSGFNGGSEYFDVDLALFRELYPQIRYLVFCDNVFSNLFFSQCVCKAGYMSRDIIDSGEVFEPKTVESSFIVNSDSTFAYLFGIDLETNDFVWLNSARDSQAAVAGTTPFAFLIDYFHVTDVVSMGSFFRMMASEVVDDPALADVILTDHPVDAPEGAEVIREYDFERMIALMNA